jgi:hypothetical protein
MSSLAPRTGLRAGIRGLHSQSRKPHPLRAPHPRCAYVSRYLLCESDRPTIGSIHAVSLRRLAFVDDRNARTIPQPLHAVGTFSVRDFNPTVVSGNRHEALGVASSRRSLRFLIVSSQHARSVRWPTQPARRTIAFGSICLKIKNFTAASIAGV